MADAYRMLRRAVRDRLQVTCFYDGRFRAICPHVLGTKDGRRRVLAFQFAGDSESGLPPGGEWRCMDVDGIRDAALREGPWRTGRHRHNPQHCIDAVDVATAY